MTDGTGAHTAPLVEPTLSPKIKLRQFIVLMWKHLTVRKSRFIATPFELLSPCFFFILMAVLRSELNPVSPFDRMNATELRKQMVHHTETIPLENTISPALILYSPDSALADALMNEVGQRLNLKRLTTFPSWNSRGYYPFSNDTLSSINSFIKEMRDNSAVVMFQDMETGPWPRKLNYTIRMKSDFKTHIYQSLDDESGPHERFGAIYESFMRLQWAIDSSYVTILSGDNIDQPVAFQEFPYNTRLNFENLSIITTILRFACAFSLMLPFVFLLTRLLEERATGVQELIKMVGVSNNVLAFSHFANVVPTGLIYAICGTIVVKATATPYIPKSDGFLIFIMLLLHFCSIMALAFVCSYLTKSAQYATTLSVICFILSWIPTRLLDYKMIPRALIFFTGLLPHVPMNWFWYEVEMLEKPGGAIGWDNMWTAHTKYSGSVALAFLMMLLQTVLFLKLAWYLSMVVPGKYGVGQPWNFVLQRSYWMRKKVDPVSSLDDGEEEPIPAKDQRYFEDPLANENAMQHEVGIKIANVYKTFGKDTALSNVSFDVYKGEITVLLGHNGAGKTTLMSIITGMTSATAGTVYINGADVSRDQGELRRQLGLCPQHNLFFPDLTVLEHLMFFAMLKGSPYGAARKSSLELLARLGLEGKAGARSGELSGGMQRRLQLACALAGGASVLVLDEPTSGLDVETRRELWDLLLTLRGDRTVLLTTHFMEEADALGDRVAALHKGRLRCHATPMYLKKSIGTGYRLSLTTIGLPKEAAITSLITSIVPDASLKESSYNSISYNLPAQHSNKFPQLFSALELNRSQLGVDSIGVGVSSLEEVFLKLCSDVDTKFTQETVDNSAPEPTYSRISGLCLWLRQSWVLMRRQMRYILFKRGSFLVLQVLLPLLSIFFFTYVLNDAHDEDKDRNRLAAMNLDLYKNVLNKKALYSVDRSHAEAADRVAASYKDVTFENTNDVAETVLLSAEDNDLSEYNKYLVGVELNSTNAKILYTTIVRHAAPVALNLLSNMVAAKHLPWATGRTITTNNYPLEGSYIRVYDHKMKEPKDITACATWTIIVVCIIAGALMNSVTLPIKERQSGTRHIHIMSGCPPAVHWLTTLAFHTLLYAVLLVLPTAAITLIDQQMTFNQPTFVGSFILIMVVGSAAFLAFCYLISFNFSERGAGLFLTVVIVFLGLVPAIVQTIADMTHQSIGAWSIPVSLANYLFPTAAMTSAVYRATGVARANAYCVLNLVKCPNIIPHLGLDVEQCCAMQRGPACTLCMENMAPGKQLIILAVQLVLYTVLVIVTQYGAFNSLYDRLVNMSYRPGATRFNDEMVRAEKTYVNKGIQLPPKQIADAMLVNDVHKNYFRLLKPKSPCNAVKGVSFSIKKGECFGLLGVNGAGKSTTFKMITGEECPTRGDIFANGQHLKWPRSQYLRSLGYCPQFFGLDEFLTGQENLSLLLTLRGLGEQDVKAETESWIGVVGLERYRDVLVDGYSGGCMRRLATAAALSSGAPVTLLDEPTSGVDVSARRRVWLALRRGLRQNRAVIITSHSMDEMEALCDRIAIMSGGELGALGSACALRAAHAAGHALVLKLGGAQPVGDVVDSVEPAIKSLKESLKTKFNCSLKDEHKTMLHYHINETMRYSELFTALEQLKLEFPHLIEDYSVTETTLEEVFLSFAQPNPPAEPHPV